MDFEDYGAVIIVAVNIIRPVKINISTGCHLRLQSETECVYLGQVLATQRETITINTQPTDCTYIRVSCISAQVANQVKANDHIYPVFEDAAREKPASPAPVSTPLQAPVSVPDDCRFSIIIEILQHLGEHQFIPKFK